MRYLGRKSTGKIKLHAQYQLNEINEHINNICNILWHWKLIFRGLSPSAMQLHAVASAFLQLIDYKIRRHGTTCLIFDRKSYKFVSS